MLLCCETVSRRTPELFSALSGCESGENQAQSPSLSSLYLVANPWFNLAYCAMLTGSLNPLENIMQTSRFQLGLIATLAVGLGFSFASSQAIGYPAGSAISHGVNPVQSFGGTLSTDTSSILLTVASDQDFVVTDVSLTAKSTDNDCMDKIDVQILAADTTVAAYSVSTSYERDYYGDHTLADSVQESMVSGLRIQGGDTLSLRTTSYDTFTYSGCSSGRTPSVTYTLSGYYARP